MNILQSWSNSLTIFKPSNLKLFLLVTLKSIIETYKLLFTTFWPLTLIIVTMLFLGEQLVLLLTVFFLCLIIRPSVLKKNYNYLKGYSSHFLMYVAIILCIIIAQQFQLFSFIFNSMIWFISLGYVFAVSLVILIIFFILLILPFFYFTIFFFLDSDGRLNALFKSFVRAVSMVIFNLPFVAIASTLFFLTLFLISYVMTVINIHFIVIRLFHLLIIMPTMLCFWNNFYIKNIHENFDLYFKRKEA